MLEDEKRKKIITIAVLIVIFFGFVMLIFNYGMNFYNKVKCGSRKTVEKMLDYCQSRGNKLIDVKFEDGLCVGICGR